ncbi:MAG: FHA domain-containing protein [Gaiellaceae bacterium]
MILASSSLEETLLVLKVVFLVLLYLFIFRIVRSAGRDVRLPQESFVMRPGVAAGAVPRAAPHATGRLVVVESRILGIGDELSLEDSELTIGRGAQNDVALEGDEFASARHVRIEPRRDGVWVHDLGSTNGTYVNGVQLEGAKRLDPGDVVRVGETELRYDS